MTALCKRAVARNLHGIDSLLDISELSSHLAETVERNWRLDIALGQGQRLLKCSQVRLDCCCSALCGDASRHVFLVLVANRKPWKGTLISSPRAAPHADGDIPDYRSESLALRYRRIVPLADGQPASNT